MNIAIFSVNFGLLVLIWIVQLIVYPSFFEAAESRFIEWHKRYTTRVSFIVVPLMLIQVVLLGYLLLTNGLQVFLIIQSALVAFVWAVTFFVSVPCHNKLASGKDKPAIQRLVSTNWYRTAAWTLVVVIDFIGMVGRPE